MPFEELETITKANEPPSAVLTYMRPPARAKPGKDYDREKVKPRLTVTLPTKVFISQKKAFVLRSEALLRAPVRLRPGAGRRDFRRRAVRGPAHQRRRV